MKSKLKTIWKYGIIFSDNQRELDSYSYECDNILHNGLLSRVKEKTLQEIVEIHPNFAKYYAMAMMPLYKTYGGIYGRGGTENPRISLKSLLTKQENNEDMKYVLIWKIMK